MLFRLRVFSAKREKISRTCKKCEKGTTGIVDIILRNLTSSKIQGWGLEPQRERETESAHRLT